MAHVEHCSTGQRNNEVALLSERRSDTCGMINERMPACVCWQRTLMHQREAVRSGPAALEQHVQRGDAGVRQERKQLTHSWQHTMSLRSFCSVLVCGIVCGCVF